MPPGHIRNVLVALSTLPSLYHTLFQYRFNTTHAFFAGHAIHYYIIAALSEILGGLFPAVQQLSENMQVHGTVYPASNTPHTLLAEFTHGTKLSGEATITAAGLLLKTISVSETHPANGTPKAVQTDIHAILDADVVVLGPGSLFTSILPNYNIGNLGDAVLKTKATDI